ncbi:MAG: hypothetical protein QW367_02460 [Candidatus Aenigmatarchaeota archaeon]
MISSKLYPIFIILIILFILNLFPNISFSQEIKIFHLKPTSILNCIKVGTTSTCNLANITKDDSTYERISITSASSSKNYGLINVSFEKLNRYDINIINLTVGVKGAKCQGLVCDSDDTHLGDNANDKCYLLIRSNRLLNSFPNSSATCNLWKPSIFTYVELPFLSNISSILELTETNLTAEWYGYDDDDRNVWFAMDYFYINLTYFDLFYSNWNFYNFTDGNALNEPIEIKRGDIIKAGALFDITEVKYAYVTLVTPNNEKIILSSIDHPNLFNIQNISTYKYWVNFTINTSNTTLYKIAEAYNISITAINKLDGYNSTTFKTFYLYGYSEISEIYVNDTYLYPNQTTLISCKVEDANSSIPLNNYIVNFYVNDDFIGSNVSDINGFATIEYRFDNEGGYIIKCNITDNETLYYYASKENSKIINLKVLNLSSSISLKNYLNFGEEQIISINITNASEIKLAIVNISFVEIKDYNLVETFEIKNLSLNECYEPYLCNYQLKFVPRRSGNYNLTFFIDADSPYGILINISNFSVSFGNALINITFPSFDKILINQTFLFKFNVLAINGDVWFVNISLNSTNISVINILENIYKPNLYSITNGSLIEISYLVKAENFGITTINISAIPLNGSSYTISKDYEVVGFNSSILKNYLNFGEMQKYFVNITGNVSEIKRVYAIIEFFNITDCKLNKTFLEINFTIEKILENIYIYSISYIPPRSGNYLTKIFVESSSGIAINESKEYFVSFGSAEIFVINPYYFVLPNQTFNIIVGIKAINGDLWNISTNISILNQIPINLTNDETNYHINSIEAIASGSFCKDKWKAYSTYTLGNEITTITFYAYPQNGSSNVYSESFEIILPLKPYIEPNISFIDEYVIFKVPVFGNASNFKINASIFKPNNIIENVSFFTAIPKNYSECNIEIETGNIAPKGIANANINNEFSIFAIDNNSNTSWFNLDSNAISQLNITLPKIITVDRVEIEWIGSSTIANISYRDTNNNLVILGENVLVNSTKSLLILKKELPFKTNEIIIDIAGSIAIFEVRIIAITPKIDYCYEFYFNFTNFTRSGIYNVSFFAITEFEDKIFYDNASFFINFGIPEILISKDTYPIMLSGQTQNYSIILKAYKGDLMNITLFFNSENEEYINITSNESFYKTIEEVLWNEEKIISWEILAKIKGEPNITILTFINSSCYYCYKNNSAEFNITIYPLDINPPTIEDFWFAIKNKNSSVFNLNDEILIAAKVIDDIFVKKVIAEITYPNGTSINVSMIQNNDFWIFKFSKDKLEVDQTGNYSIKLYAFDLNETYNYNISVDKNFIVLNIYFIDYEPKYLLYNFGEKIRFFAKDINNFIVENAIWNETNYNISNVSTYFEILLTKDLFNIGKIELNVSIFKNGNIGNKNISFNLTDLLNIEIISPPYNYIFEKGIQITGPGLLPSIKVQNARKDKYLENLYSEIYCLDSDFVFTKFDNSYFYFNACGALANTYSFKDCSSRCYSPNVSNQKFNISFYVKDNFGNEGFNYVILSTKSEILFPQSIVSSGIGGFPAAPTSIKQCECTNWQDIGCGKGKCSLNQLYQIRSCKPAGCDIEERCIESILCTPIEIEFLIDEKLDLIQGETKMLVGIIKNIGKKQAFIKIEYNSTCCEINLNENEFKLDVGEIKSLIFVIHSYLNESIGEYKLDINIFDKIEKKKLISKSVIINLNLNQLFIKKAKLINEFEKLKPTIQEYKIYNILSAEILNLIDKTSKIIEVLDNYIKNDDLKNFEISIIEIEKNIEKIKDYLENKKINLFFAKYKDEIFVIIIVSFILSYTISQIIIPYLKISKEIKKLIIEEEVILKQRREIQKQFFMRKISDEIFKKLITDTQNKLLAIRGKIKTLNEEKSRLLKERINPIYIIKIIINAARKIKK